MIRGNNNACRKAKCVLESEDEVEEKGLYNEIYLIIFSTVLFALGLILEFIIGWRSIAYLLFVATSVLAGYEIAKEGLNSLLFRRKLSIDFLIMVAAIGSFFIGHCEEGAAVIYLFYIAEYLEDYAGERARKSIQLLMELAPEKARVKRDGMEVEVDIDDIKIRDIVIVRPGEKIPLDGVIVNGGSSVNQAPITGESTPVEKSIGDEVYAGTLNNEGFLEIEVTKKSDETLLSKIIRLVEEAQKVKSPTEKFIDKFSKYYTPSVIFLAVCVATIPKLIFGLLFEEWIYKALVLLVVSCPCALAISTPVAMVSAITNAARNGVLIKGSLYIEEINKVKVFAFDKTGTLTEGRLEVTDIIGFGNPNTSTLVDVASIEAMSEHPIAKAIVDEAIKKRLELIGVEEFKAIPGKGVIGKINGEYYYIGNRKLFEELSLKVPEDSAKRLENEGKTVIFVGKPDKIIGLMAVRDRIRDSTIEVIRELKKKGIKTIMITGDNERTARAIAEKIGIDEYRPNLLPDDKVRIIEELSREYGHVAMVGDGVNDAPALARANVGIAMGAIGSDVAVETADIALMQDDLSKIPYLVKLSRKTLEIVKENVLASISIKGSFTVLVFPGLITLWLAVAIGDMGLSLAVILNAMRLSLVKKKLSLA